jgi:hypothetical protein
MYAATLALWFVTAALAGVQEVGLPSGYYATAREALKHPVRTANDCLASLAADKCVVVAIGFDSKNSSGLAWAGRWRGLSRSPA